MSLNNGLNHYKVQITLRPRKDDFGRGSRVLYDEIDAIDEEQALDFAKQRFEGFLADGVTIETKIRLRYI